MLKKNIRQVTYLPELKINFGLFQDSGGEGDKRIRGEIE